MAQKNNIQFNIDFKKGDTKALESLKKDIAEIQRLAGNVDFTGGMETSEIQKMVNAARTLETALDQAFDVDLNAVNVQKFNQILKQSGMSAETLQADLASAGAIGQQAFLKMTGQLMQFNTVTKQTNHFLDNLATTFFNTIKWSVMSSIVNNISGTIQKSFYYIKDLDTALNDIRIVTNKSADDMDRFAVKANDAAKALAVSTQDYAEGSLIYYQQGLDDATVKTMTDITAKTANVTAQSMGTVSEQLTAVWNGYQVANQAAEEGMQVYEEYVDKMAAVGATTASDLEELSTAMSKVASAASAMGVDFDDLNAQIATIVSVTRQAPESVGTALKTIYARLGDLKVDGVDEFGVKLGEITSQMETMGISILDTNGDMRAMSDVMMEVAAKWQTWTSAQRQAAAVAMAGKRQYNNLVALFDNWDMHEKALATSMNAVGTLNEQQAIALESLANKMEIMEATAQDLYDNLFDEESLSDLVEAGTKALQLVADLSESLGGLKNILPMIGSLGLQVFNEQIGRGLATIVTNAQNARKEEEGILNTQAQLQAMFSESSILQYNPQETTGALRQDLQELYNYYQDMAPYQSSMTKEQKEQYNNILQMKISAGELNAEIQEQSKYWSQSVKPLNFINQNIVEELSNTEKVDIEIQKINSVVDSLNKHIGALSGEESLDYLTSVAHQLGEETKLTEKEIERIIALIKSAYKNTENVEDAISQVVNRISQAGNKLSDLQVNQGKANSLSNSFKNVGESARQAAEQVKRFSDATKALSGLGQIASSINTLQHVNEILDNDDLSIIEKGTQALTSYGFAIPMLLNGFKAFGEGISPVTKAIQTHTAAINANKIAKEASIAVTEAENKVNLTANSIRSATLHGSQEEVKSAMELIKQKILKNEITTESQLAEEMENIAQEKGITLDSADYLAQQQLMVAKQGETAATIQATAAQEAYNKAKLSGISKALMFAVALGVVGTAIIKALDAEEDRKIAIIQSRQEEQKAFEERHAEAQQEIQDRQDLAQSYIDLYSQYKDGNTEKSAMIQKTNELVDVFGEERIAVANLTGDYESLNKEMLEYRQNQIQAKMQQNVQEIQEQRKNIGNKYSGVVSFSQEDYNNLSDDNPLKQVLTEIPGWDKYGLDFSQVSDEWLAQNIGAINAYLQKAGVDVSEFSRYAGNIRDLYAENQRLQVEEVASTKYLSNVDSYSDYSKILKETIEQLRETGQYGSEGELTQAAIKMLSGLSGNNEAYAERASAENYLLNTKYADNEAIKTALANMMESLDEDDLTLLLEGKVAIDPNNIEQSITEGLARVKQSFAQEDLSIVNDLREKLISDKKLTNKELEEMLQERNALAQEYATELYDFENKSELEQVQTLNAIARAKMDQNREYATEGIKSQQEYVDDYDEKIEELNNLDLIRAKTSDHLTDDQEQRYKELQEYIEANKETYEDYLNEIKSFDLDDSIFNNLMSGMDGIISEAKILKDIAEDVGESWTIAADDIEHFGKNFPEVLAAQENYNFLQDGSIQLTKEGQQALQDLVEERKRDLIAQNEAYQLELQKQADIQKATAEYYENQAALLRDYLDNNRKSTTIEADLANNLRNYEDELRETANLNEAELQKAIQQYLGETVDVAQQDTEKLYDYWVGVGNAAQNAALAYENKHFEDPGMRPTGGGVGTKTKGDAYSGSSEKPQYISDATDAQIEALIKQYDESASEAWNKYTDYISKKAGVGAALQESLNALDNAAAGKGGKQSKSKGSDKDKSKDEKEYRDEFNRYFDIEKAIDAVDEATKRLQKDQKNLHGKELIASLKKENELIEEQTANYEKLYELQREEASELIGKLKALGVAFDESGAITNYADATKSALKKYNDAVEQYNAGVLDDAAFKIHEKAYESFKKTLERYEELYYKEMIDTQDKIDDNNRKVLENNLKGWEAEIQLKLDLQEAERKWADFLHEINKDYKKVYKNVNAEMDTLIKKAKTFTGENGYAGTIATNIEKVTDVTAEIDKLVAGANSSMFESVTQAQEELKKLYDTLMSDAKELENLQEEAWENYLDGIDQVADKFDDLNDRFKRITDELAFQGELIELLYGEEAYGLMNKLYSGQEKSLENQLQSVRQQEQMWKKLFDESGATMQNQSDWTEDQKKYYDQWIAAQDELNDLVIDYIKLLKDDYLNTVKDTLFELEKAIAGARLDDVKTQWERIAANADKYYDSIEGAYEIQKFANKLNEELDKTTDLKNQQRILKFRDKEIGYLREKETLTEYDLQAAEARYQIMLKEMALEDARNNKTSMKLTRNEQGNWSYQYIADEDDVLSKRQELLDSFNNLYQLASDAYEKNLESLQSLQEEYLARSAEIEELALTDKELADQRRAELDAWYFEQYRLLSDENALYRNDLVTSGAALLLEVYNQDVSAYESMTDTEKAMIDALVESHIENYMDLEEKMGENFNNINDMSQELMEKTREDWTSSAQTIADTWNGSHGSSVRSMVLDAHSRISQATDDYKEKVDWCADAVGRDFGPEGITGAIDKASEATVNLKNLTTEMVNESIDGLDRLKSQVGEVENAWKSLMDQIRKAIQLINEYMQKQAQAANMPTAGIDGNGGLGNTDATGGGSGGGKGGKDNGPSKPLQTTGYYYIAHQRDSSAEVTGVTGDLATAENVIRDYREDDGDGSIYKVTYRNGVEIDRELMPFDTGGYTGEWAGQKDGKLGILHQKELVLNADDTKNFLAGIRTLRDMTNLNGTISGAITNSIANMALKYGMINAGSYGTVSTNSPIGGGDTYYVTAEFPNAENVNEIREALMSLPNIASQYIGRRA